jgi:hypothetical protein
VPAYCAVHEQVQLEPPFHEAYKAVPWLLQKFAALQAVHVGMHLVHAW